MSTENNILEQDISIEKVNLNGQFIKIKFSGKINGPASDSSSAFNQMVHNDLINAFGLLDLHLGLIYEQIEEMKFVPKDDNDIEDISEPSIFRLNDKNQVKAISCNCKGFVITGANEGVQLIGGIYI